MANKLTNKFKLVNARKILDIFSSATDSVYCFNGRVTEWTINDSTPDAIVDSLGADITNWDDLVYAKKISTNDVSLVIPAREWQADTVYDPYEHDVDMSVKDWYVTGMTSGRVFKCISNNANSKSTIDPTNASQLATPSKTDVNITADGYVWKYMYTANNTSDFAVIDGSFAWFPIKELLLEDSSDQWDIQESAVSGGIHHIKSLLSTPSYSGYTDGHPVSVVSPDGTGFVAEIDTYGAGGGSKKYIKVTNPGSGYTRVDKVLVNGSLDTNLKAIISPISGHGFNAARELDASTIMVRCAFSPTEPELGNTTDTYNEYRKIGLVLNPIVSWGNYDTITTGGTSVSSGTRYVDSFADQRIKITTVNTTDVTGIADDTEIWQGNATKEDATIRGYVTSRNSVSKFIYAVTTSGTFTSSSDIYKQSGGSIPAASINTITSSTPDASTTILYPLKRYSGDVIYIDHQTAITRSSATETARIVIQF